jgi:hypothetical protein
MNLKDEDMCDRCDRALEKSQETEIKAREKKHAAQFKCKKCGNGLPLHRARYCMECIPDHASSNGINRSIPVDLADDDYMYC